jgi:short-subunit dehydrogenase
VFTWILLLIIGILIFLKPLSSILLTFYHHFRPLHLKSRYPSPWAIITGASDGIGFGFCQELSKQGYNICLISRNREKLEQKVQELRAEFGGKVEYRVVVADFRESFLEGFFGKLEQELDGIEPGILVNNVGIS